MISGHRAANKFNGSRESSRRNLGSTMLNKCMVLFMYGFMWIKTSNPDSMCCPLTTGSINYRTGARPFTTSAAMRRTFQRTERTSSTLSTSTSTSLRGGRCSKSSGFQCGRGGTTLTSAKSFSTRIKRSGSSNKIYTRN